MPTPIRDYLSTERDGKRLERTTTPLTGGGAPLETRDRYAERLRRESKERDQRMDQALRHAAEQDRHNRLLDRVAWVLAGGPPDLEGMTTRAKHALQVLQGLEAHRQGNDLRDVFVVEESSIGQWNWQRMEAGGLRTSLSRGPWYETREEAIQAAVRAGGLILGVHAVQTRRRNPSSTS